MNENDVQLVEQQTQQSRLHTLCDTGSVLTHHCCDTWMSQLGQNPHLINEIRLETLVVISEELEYGTQATPITFSSRRQHGDRAYMLLVIQTL